MPFKVFAVNEILTAADVNDYFAEQVISTFSGTAQRAAALGTPVTGQFTFITGTSSLEYWNGSSWTVFSGGGGAAEDALMLMGG